jgi:Ca-activated chloride channel family protein
MGQRLEIAMISHVIQVIPLARAHACLATISAALALAGPALAQESMEITIRGELGGASQVIIPQARAFVLRPRITPGPPHVVAPPQVQIESVNARVRILERAAVTELEINLRNPSAQQIEAVLLLPVPDGAVVSEFDFEGPASESTARVLPRDEARRLYDAIVANVRDPALLEFAGYNLVRSSVFPIAAGGTQKLKLKYEHLLSAEGNRVDYVLPRSESLDRRAPWRLVVDVQSKSPISTAYSPSHDIRTTRRSPNHIVLHAMNEGELNPGPFLLSYLVETQDVSASLFSYPDPSIGGGYFLVMAGLPASDRNLRKQIKREVTVVIDRSGSMAGGKMDQARAAALQVIEGLADGEAFNIIDYSTTIASFEAKPVVKGASNRAAARHYIESIRSGGGTNIHDALLEALRPQPIDGMLPIVLFLTDGLPTVGRTSELAIRELVEKGNPYRRRVFTFGVGHDVNVPLLDRLADLTRASGTYVLPEEDIEVKVAQVFQKLYGPVFKDIQLSTSSGEASTRLVRELIPSPIPDLYEGDQLILLGQYSATSGAGPIQFTFTGDFSGTPRTFAFTFGVEKSATTRNGFVPRLWASRRIAYLVDQIRQAGAEISGQPAVAGSTMFSDPRLRELSEEILRLSTEFGVLTEYTSFLATEGANLAGWNSLHDTCSNNLDTRAVRSRSGVAAVNQGMNFNAQKGQTTLNYQNAYIDDKLNRVQTAAVQQVCDRTFFKRGEQWIDARLITANKQAEGAAAFQPDQIIDFGSPEHMAVLQQLINENRQAVLSLQGDIIIQYQGRNILVRQPNDTQ